MSTSKYGFSDGDAKRIGKAVRRVERLPQSLIGSDTPTRFDPRNYFLAQIVLTGPDDAADFDSDDPRYWVKRARVCNDGDTADGLLETEILPTDHPYYTHVCATNITEIIAETHSLPLERTVMVWWDYDQTDEAKVRYYFDAGETLPTGELQHQVFQMVTQNSVGFGFVQAHALP